MRVTLAVCTWNRGDLLRQTLAQLEQMPVPASVQLDLVVVNNNCTDNTDQVIDEFRKRLALRRVFEPRTGVAHSRNAAVASATGEYVAFVDDDALVDESWLVELVAATRAFPEAAALGGIIEPWFPEPADPELLQAFQWLKTGFCGLDHRRAPGPLPDDLIVHGPNMAYRMEALKDLRFHHAFGGTPTSTMGGDERELLSRLRAAGGTVVWWPRLLVRHHVLPSRMTIDYCLRFAADKGHERILSETPSATPTLFGAPRWLWRRWITVCLKYLTSFATPGQPDFDGALLSGRVEGQVSRRVRALTWRKELAYLGGMIRGHRWLRDQPGQGALVSNKADHA